MTREELRDTIRFELTGFIVECELDNDALDFLITSKLKELRRYYSTTVYKTIPYARCIDLTNSGIDALNVNAVYRQDAYGTNESDAAKYDPFYATLYISFTGGGNIYNLSNFVNNYASWNTLLQIRNTMSTDLDFNRDIVNNRLYINTMDEPIYITIEYVPNIYEVEDIKDEYWIDILLRLCVAQAKQTLGRIRTKAVHTNGLIQLDGDTILAEGNEELRDIRETLRINKALYGNIKD